jgi:predicted GNAT family acetyltransferase
VTPNDRSPSSALRAATTEDEVEPDAEPEIEIRHDEGVRRFIAPLGSSTAFLQYRLRAGRFVIVHTEVPPSLGGRGLAARRVARVSAVEVDAGRTPEVGATVRRRGRHRERVALAASHGPIQPGE